MASRRSPPSPIHKTSVEQKKHSRQTALNRAKKTSQVGSPQLRELLREKCRMRVREARKSKFDGSRCLDNTEDNTLVGQILRQELADLETDLVIQQLIYRELIDEMNMWFAQQMEEEEEYLINIGETDDVAFCPMCQKSELCRSPDSNLVKCLCGVSFNYNGSPELLARTLKKTFARHEKGCGEILNFFVEQNSNGSEKMLNAICESCDYFVSVT